MDVHSPRARRAASRDAAQRGSGGWPSNAVRAGHLGRRPPGVLVARALDRLRCEMGLRRPTFSQKQDGSVILETALMILVLLVLTFGMIDFGRVMYLSNNLISAAREGARGGAVMASPVSVSSVKTIVKNRFNSYTFGGDNLKDADITVTDNS